MAIKIMLIKIMGRKIRVIKIMLIKIMGRKIMVRNVRVVHSYIC